MFTLTTVISLLSALLLSSFYNQDVQLLGVESNHSTVMFSIPIAGMTRVTGKFNDYSIDIDYVDKDITKSSITAVIQTASIDTGIPVRDQDLQSDNFFDAEKYPEITFKSSSIIKEGANYVAKGTVFMHGISKEMDLPFKITGSSGENTIGFSSRFVIDRMDFEVAKDFKHTLIDNFLGEEVEVEIDFWTRKRKVKK